MKYYFVILTGIVSVMFTACGADYIFSEYKPIAASGWDYKDKVDFEFVVEDTTMLYNLILEVTHADTFATENAYVKVQTTFPDGNTTEQQLSLELASKSGVWFGKCSSGLCNLGIVLQQNLVFAKAGKYKVSFEQFGRTNPLIGLNKIGLLVENTGMKKGQTKASGSKKKPETSH